MARCRRTLIGQRKGNRGKVGVVRMGIGVVWENIFHFFHKKCETGGTGGKEVHGGGWGWSKHVMYIYESSKIKPTKLYNQHRTQSLQEGRLSCVWLQTSLHWPLEKQPSVLGHSSQLHKVGTGQERNTSIASPQTTSNKRGAKAGKRHWICFWQVWIHRPSDYNKN